MYLTQITFFFKKYSYGYIDETGWDEIPKNLGVENIDHPNL